MSVNVVWQEGMAFEVQQDGHTFLIDAVEETGGQDRGPRPKALMLSSLAGCTGMDVIFILKKLHVDVARFEVNVDAELTDEHPKRFTKMVSHYKLWGEGLEAQEKKVRRAVRLSEDMYCGVSATLRPSVTLEAKIFINDVELPHDPDDDARRFANA